MPYLDIVDQKCLICVFLGRRLKKYCHIWNPWICLVAKFGAKIKILKFVAGNAWFGLEFENIIVTFDICTLEFVKYESLNHTVNFDIGSAFHFFWRSGSGSGSAL